MDIIKDSYKVEGMSCAACAISIESMLNSLDGVSKANVNYANSSVWIEFDEDLITEYLLSKRVEQIGFKLVISKTDVSLESIRKKEKQRLDIAKSKALYSILLSIPVFVISMFSIEIPAKNWILFVLSTPVVFWFGKDFFVIAYKQAMHKSVNMDTLVSLGTGSAYIFSVINTLLPDFFLSRKIEPHVYYEAATVIIALILLGRFFEEKAKSRTSDSIKKLIGLRVKSARVERNGVQKEIPVEEVVLGDVIYIRPGEKIPVDGKIIDGDSTLDESMITGEAIPVDKGIGDIVIGSTINKNGSFIMIAQRIGEQTMLSQIINMVSQAQGSKAPVQHLADRIARIFVPLVIGVAIISFILWFIFGPEPRSTHAFVSLLSVLIIACPCALGLATPTAIMVGIGKGAEKGILIKDAKCLEIAKKIDTIVTDKTGTLTEGKPKVQEVFFRDGIILKPEIENLVNIEMYSEHPLASAVLEYYQSYQQTEKVEDFKNIPGKGIIAKIGGNTFYSGNLALLESNSIKVDNIFKEKANEFTKKNYTLVYFAKNDTPIAILGVSDTVKSSSKASVQMLRDMGIETTMLSGDNFKSAEYVARQTGIRDVLAHLLPSDKLGYIKALQKRGQRVAMIGDGINDAPALAQANLGIAMGNGTDIAIENAEITIVKGNLHKIAQAIRLSEATVRTIKQNLFWAFIYNIIAIPIAAGVLYPINGFQLNPMIAGAAMAFSSISVVLNSLRLRSNKVLC